MFFVGCTGDISKKVPEFRLIKRFSSQLKNEQGLVLWCYGINDNDPDYYQRKRKNGVTNYSVDYALYKTQNDVVSLEEARCLLVSVVESFLNEINSDPEVRKNLDVYPFPSKLLTVGVSFVDENGWDRGNGGISGARLYEGKIRYERYEIYEYTPPAIDGKHFDVHKESYEEALDIVKSQGCLHLFK
jgi:hypothetical protein